MILLNVDYGSVNLRKIICMTFFNVDYGSVNLRKIICMTSFNVDYGLWKVGKFRKNQFR
jgi:hypothetical protein